MKRRVVVAVVPVEVGADVIGVMTRTQYLDPDASDDACNFTDKGALAEVIGAALDDRPSRAYHEYLARISHHGQVRHGGYRTTG